MNEKKHLNSQINKKKTLYWGIDISNESITPILKKHNIDDYVNINKMNLKNEFHATLLFIKKDNLHEEEKYKKLEGTACKLEISVLGKTPNAVAARIDKMTYNLDNDEIDVPSDQKLVNHITIALGNGTKAKDSIFSLQDEINLTNLPETITLYGTIRRYTTP